jgi:hypothetical protein
LGIPALANTAIECCGIERLGAAEETTDFAAVEKFNMIQHWKLLSVGVSLFSKCEALRLSL